MWDPELEQHRAETQAFNAQIEAFLADLPGVEEQGAVAARAARRDGTGSFPAPVFLDEAEDLTCPGPAGDIGLRVIRAAEPRGVYLHIHGGGWSLGAGDMQDPGLRELVDSTGLTAVSVDYRLAPEHPHPAGPNDCEAAALWVLDHLASEFDAPATIVIGGESAGAHLSLLTVLRLRDRHQATGAFVGMNLVYGAYDLSGTPSQRSWTRNLVLSPGNLAYFMDCYLPDADAEGRRDPDISPLYADLTGLPPALLSVGTLDPLLDDSLFLHGRLQAAGVPSELVVYPDAIHGFNAFPIAMGKACNQRQHAWISTRLDA